MRPPPRRSSRGCLRASLDILLPHRDALAVSVEAGSDLTPTTTLAGLWSISSTAQCCPTCRSADTWMSAPPATSGSPSGPGLILPAHRRCAVDLGWQLGLNVVFFGLSPSVDLFPLREPDPYAPSGPAPRPAGLAYYRVAILGTVGL